jgi:ATP-dependent Clp protease adaptor protein ClpS
MDTDKSVRNRSKGSDDVGNKKSLILHNDDYHTFEYVIDALMEICNMERVQAIQCTYLVHYKDKCEVKKGSKSELLPMRRALSAKDLKATIH